MSLWDNTPATLTSFAPLTSEVQSTGNFLSRLFRRGKDDSDMSSAEGSRTSSRDVSVERGTSREQSVDRSTRESSLNPSSSSLDVSNIVDIDSEGKEERPSNGTTGSDDSSNKSEASHRRMSVVARLTDILNRRTATLQVYRDSDFKQYWMPDSSCKECYDCNDKFTTFRRRHHCRICGQIFCNNCCNQELSGKIIGYKGGIRVCKYCYQIVPRVTKEVLHGMQSDGSLSPDLGARGQRSSLDLHGSLNLRSPGDKDSSQDAMPPFDLTPQSEYVVTMNFPSERRLLTQDSAQLRNLYALMMDEERGVEFDSYRIRLRTNNRCIAGNKLVEWLIQQDKVATRLQAVAIGQALIDAEYLEPIHNITIPFRDDFTLYRPVQVAMPISVSPDHSAVKEMENEDSAPLWFQQIQPNMQQPDSLEGHHNHSMQASDADGEEKSSIMSHSDLSEDSTGKIKVDERHFDDPLPQAISQSQDEAAEPMFSEVVTATSQSSGNLGHWRNLSMTTDDEDEKETFDKLQQEHHEHLTVLTRQLLAEEHLSLSWAEIIITTVDRVSLFVRPDIKDSTDDMDIRKYVHIKKIPGGTREQTGLVHGVIFKKNIANRKMSQTVGKPSVLLLFGSIEYQRVENKLSALQPLISQEREFLKKSIAKIAGLKQKPNILIVEKSVANLAQQFLLEEGITLINNVKLSVMERLSRFLDADIVTSIDSLVHGVRLGFCHNFSVQNYVLPAGDTKTMISFSGCATHLGCSITLRGGSASELKRVKKILNFMLYASYHSRLEISFCIDECMVPARKADFVLDKDEAEQEEAKDKDNGENNVVADPQGVEDSGDQVEESDSNEAFGKDMLAGLDIVKGVVVPGEGTADTVRDSEARESAIEIADSVKDQPDDCDMGSEKDIKDRDSEDTVERQVQEPVTGEVVAEKRRSMDGDRISSFIRTDLDEEVSGSGNNMEARTESKGEDLKHSCDSDQSESDSVSFFLPDSGQVVNQSESRIPNQSGSSSQSETRTDQEGPQTEKQDFEREESSPRTSVKLKNETVQKIPQDSQMITVKSEPGLDAQHVTLRQRNRSGQRYPDRSPNLLRKSETTQLTDNSDPLNRYKINQDESIFQSSLFLQEQLLTHRHKFRKALDNVVLSASPFIKYDLPYLESETGSKCELRQYFPEEVYWSSHFSSKTNQLKQAVKYHSDQETGRKMEQPSNVQITEAHEFIRSQLILPAYDLSTQHLISKFRAYGGRINIIDTDSTPQTKKGTSHSSRGKENKYSKGRQQSRDVSKGSNSVRENGAVWERKTDCLDPHKHQRIAVLFSSFSYHSENHPSPCVYPWVVTMEFYGKNDITLGGFLERFCFRPSYVCPSDSCNTSMDKHIRRFIHKQGSISVMLKRHEQHVQKEQSRILMWSWCYRCKQVTPIVPMSLNTWNLSFAKYLELRFHGNTFKRRDNLQCQHSLHYDHYQYFGYEGTVASFKYSTIKLKEIKLPPFLIAFDPHVEMMHIYRLKEEIKRLTFKLLDLYSLVLNYMTSMKAESSEPLVRTINEYIAQQQVEKTRTKEVAHNAREKISSLLHLEDGAKSVKLSDEERILLEEVEDSVVTIKRSIAESVSNWNVKLQDLYVSQKRAKSLQKKDRDTVSVSNLASSEPDERENKQTDVLSTSDPMSPMIPSPPPFSEDNMSLSDMSEMDQRRKSDFSIVNFSPPPLRDVPSMTSLDSYTYGVTPENFTMEASDDDLDNMALSDADGGPLVPTETSSPDPESALPSSEDKLVLPDTISRKSTGVTEEQPDGAAAYKIGAIKKSLMNTIWQGSGAFQMQMPFHSCEHHLLPKCYKLPVVVYDHEPSSIIAYSLSCYDYHTKLYDIQSSLASCQRSSKQESDPQEKLVKEDGGGLAKRPSSAKLSFFRGNGKENIQRQEVPDTVRYVAKTENGVLESPQDEADYSVFTASMNDPADKSKSGKQVPNLHIELQFSDTTARFYCKVYFAEQFRQIRKLIFPDGEDMFIRSLSRCIQWQARGGKSGSAFCKTYDDRFILKQMSVTEVDSFEKFGPQYFQYISMSEQHQRPTALAKIVGVYRIGFRNQQNNTAMKQDLLVMENLFYNRNISQTYDLKGSERNRLVKTTRKREEELVLLDENFLRGSVDNPLYIRPHSKHVLMRAINRDSQFLSTNFVMDYSLLVGLDEQRRELVIGMIDYIRTFTWDKKLETIFKSNFGGQGKMPTVVSPEVYRNRFLDAMAKYFLPVPDQWTGLGRDADGSQWAGRERDTDM